ncbi:MAG: discoidin domain-containing protein [Phycisphaerales bacterium]|nr:MAG: discoidin domain-containing protein [Phycisphaerales bacterium]
MCRKLSYLIYFVLVLAWAGTNVVRGDTVWEGKITNDQDCVEQSNATPTGSMDFGSSDLEFMADGPIQTIGLRFTNVRVPAGAAISSAYVVLWQDDDEAQGDVHIVIHGHLTPNAPAFVDTPGNISTRPKTTEVAKWSPEWWPAGETRHQTSDISAVIEEIVNQAGWAEGNAIVLVFDQDPDNPSTTHRTSHKAANPDYVPMLHIEWSLGNAGNPNPPDEQTEVSIDADLAWTPGVFAAASNGQTLYLSESFDDVNDGVGGITQTPTSYDPGRLNYGTTYYWRVRQNNGAPDFGVNEGRVWSFTTEFFSYPIDGGDISATASSMSPGDFGPEKTIDGSGLNDNDGHSTDPLDMWLSDVLGPQPTWIEYQFDKVHSLHEMWVWNSNQAIESFMGYGPRDVTVEYSTDGADWTTLADVPEFAQAPAPATNDYAHNTTVDFGGVPAKHVRLTVNSNWGSLLPQSSLSEVRFFSIPTGATMPSPDSGATDVPVDVVLGWRVGREAVTHQVTFSADEQAVIDGTAPVAAVTDASYSPADLDVSTSYYWKVGEVNEADTPSTWESSIWSFTTSDHVVVDDFESYNDIDPPDPESHRIFEGWPDGYGVPTNGALIGNEAPPYAEQGIVHGGRQGMPMFYSNTLGATFSEATRTFGAPQDWTKHGVTMLGLYFYGEPGDPGDPSDPANTGQMYVKINDTKIPYDGPASKLAVNGWQLWTIDLASSGANLQSVSSLSIGIDGVGASGTLYFDDIGLYAAVPAPVNDWVISAASNDDEEKVLSGEMEGGSSDLELGYEDDGALPENLQIVGCRWVAVTIPQGATITEAWVQFSADDIDNSRHAGDVSVIIEGQLSPSPAVFSSTAFDISSRPTTAASVVWDIPLWTTFGGMGPDERSPDISSIIQEIVNQPDWSGDDAIVLMFRDNPANPSQGTREAGSSSAGPGAPRLHISYQ